MAKLFVGSLAYSMTDDSLFQLLTDRGYKPVSARVVTDKYSGQSRGFGFVELGPGDDMAQAIGELNGLNIEGRTIQVSEARPRESRGGGGYRSGGGGRSRGGRLEFCSSTYGFQSTVPSCYPPDSVIDTDI